MNIQKALEKEGPLPHGPPSPRNTTKETQFRAQSAEEGEHDIAKLSLSDPYSISGEISGETIKSRSPGGTLQSADRRQEPPAACELPASQEQLDCFISPSQRREAEELTVAPGSHTDPEVDWNDGDNSHSRRSWGQQRQAAEWAGGRGWAGTPGSVRQAAEWAGGRGWAGTPGSSNAQQAAEWTGGWGWAGTSGQLDVKLLQQTAQWAAVTTTQPLSLEQCGRPGPHPPTAGTTVEEHRTSGVTAGAGISDHAPTQATYFGAPCVTPSHSEESLVDEEGLDQPAIVLESFSGSGEEGGEREHRGREDEGGEVVEHRGGEGMEDGGGEVVEEEGGEEMEDGGGEVVEEEGGEGMEDEGGEVVEEEGGEGMEEEGGEVIEDEGGEGMEDESLAVERLAQEEGQERQEEGGVLAGGSSESVKYISETPVDSEEAQSRGEDASAAPASARGDGASASTRRLPETPAGASEQSSETAPLTATNAGTDSDARVDASGHTTGHTTDTRVDSAHPADLGLTDADTTVDADHRPIDLTDTDATAVFNHQPVDLIDTDAMVVAGHPGGSPAGHPGGSPAGSADATQSTLYVDVTTIFSQDDIITQEGEL